MRVSMAITWCDDLHVWEPGNWLTFTGGWDHGTFKCRDLSVMLGDGYINWEAERERDRERDRVEIVNARERWEGEHSSLTRSHSHRTAHFLSASRRRKKPVRRRKRAQDSGAKPLLFLLPRSRAVFCEKEKISCERIWITGVRIQAWRERKGWKRILENF